jgi:protein-tyrosine phosphatase
MGWSLARIRGALTRRGTIVAARGLEALRPKSAAGEGMGFERSVLFVCHGNICRSPLAEGLLRRKLAEAGLTGRIAVDSAGTNASTDGLQADARARLVAAWHGFRIDDLRARRFRVEDFDAFDRIVVFDGENRDAVLVLARTDDDRRRVSLLADEEIVDPILGRLSDFERSYRAIDAASDRLLAELR